MSLSEPSFIYQAKTPGSGFEVVKYLIYLWTYLTKKNKEKNDRYDGTLKSWHGINKREIKTF